MRPSEADLGPLELASSCPPPPDALMTLPPEGKLSPWPGPVLLQRLFGVSIRGAATPFLTLNSSRQEHGHKSGEDAWLQAQLSFLSPITEISQKGSLLTACADGQEKPSGRDSWKLCHLTEVLPDTKPKRAAEANPIPGKWSQPPTLCKDEFVRPSRDELAEHRTPKPTRALQEALGKTPGCQHRDTKIKCG